MRIELNGFVITKLANGRYYATDKHVCIETYSLEAALDFIDPGKGWNDVSKKT